eukprot:CAMPEP_0170625462 /NCGR_PEP_ID=MMETSP0224-20130122/30771_1 /TAXON_ID=285029 /ORGANISM="Togula jolla, Strain CCCM 725" /LENGTH=165 /DNA_ID=CAMNT_0010952037 /DNA_START=324 /DNA_END=821 /DNA_ORIENTATION=-
MSLDSAASSSLNFMEKEAMSLSSFPAPVKTPRSSSLIFTIKNPEGFLAVSQTSQRAFISRSNVASLVSMTSLSRLRILSSIWKCLQSSSTCGSICARSLPSAFGASPLPLPFLGRAEASGAAAAPGTCIAPAGITPPHMAANIMGFIIMGFMAPIIIMGLAAMEP